MNNGSKTPAETGMEFLEAMTSIVEILDGYRALLISHGYSETAAEQMVIHVHWKIVTG